MLYFFMARLRVLWAFILVTTCVATKGDDPVPVVKYSIQLDLLKTPDPFRLTSKLVISSQKSDQPGINSPVYLAEFKEVIQVRGNTKTENLDFKIRFELDKNGVIKPRDLPTGLHQLLLFGLTSDTITRYPPGVESPKVSETYSTTDHGGRYQRDKIRWTTVSVDHEEFTETGEHKIKDTIEKNSVTSTFLPSRPFATKVLAEKKMYDRESKLIGGNILTVDEIALEAK